jgi:nitrite reductase (NO-forming)
MKFSVLLAMAALCCAASIQAASPQVDEIRGEEVAVLTSAPHVPPPIKRRHATRVILDVEVKEHTKMLADGVSYTYWTFGDDAPGKFIRVREGDIIQTTLKNHPDNTVAHNIDFHSATGPGGGGEASFVAPGHQATFTWRAMRPGLYLYHCVAAPAGLHIANGMYGLILIEPKEGMPKVDKEFFIVQGEFYTTGAYGEEGAQQFDLKKAMQENPEYVVFNGRVGALMGENALRVKAGESVRLYLGNAGPALVSSFHVVGEIFDDVYGEGGTKVSQNHVQTTIVPVGGSSMVDFVADVPGKYEFVDHSMFRAFNKGAMGALVVEGKERPELFTGRQAEGIFDPGTRLQRLAFVPEKPAEAVKTAIIAEPAPASKPAVKPTPADTKRAPDQVVVAASNTSRAAPASPALHAKGKEVYDKVCTTCHQPDGRGMPNVFPPLAKSDYLHDTDRAIGVLIAGLQGEITVNGKKYNGVMPDFSLSNEDIAAVLSYVRSNFGNSGSAVSVADVARVRGVLAKSGSRDPRQLAREDR